jgi:Neuraminidase (sialidase)
VKDFVLNSRKILTSQISINDKNEETERLKEYIIMEKEKLEQAKKTFAEDSDKFTKYKKDLRDTTKDVQQQIETAGKEKNARVADIKLIEAEIVSKDAEIKKIEETLILCKQRKAFLDELAVSAGLKKKFVPGQTSA